MAQGCPAAPDMLNILFEPFQRWAAAQGRGVVLVGGGEVSSGSFADDVVLVAGSKEDAEFLIAGYLRWCELLHLSVTEGKTQVWCSGGRKGVRVHVGEAMVELSDQFKIVGVVIAAASEKEATKRHLTGRVEKAVMSGRRLEAMAVPPWMKAHLWRAVVLPQALYGCEVRDVKVAPKQLGRVVAVGKRVLRGSLKLASWGAPELLMSQALGEVGFRDPLIEVRCRQARWLVEMANGQDLVGRLHRALSMRTVAGSRWQDPCDALRAAVEDLGWTVEINWGAKGVSRASWPTIAPEPPPLNAEVVLRPRDGPLSQGAWFTDGSVGRRGGGAAAVEVGTGNVKTCFVPAARSSTQPELVGIRLAVEQGLGLCTRTPWRP